MQHARTRSIPPRPVLLRDQLGRVAVHGVRLHPLYPPYKQARDRYEHEREWPVSISNTKLTWGVYKYSIVAVGGVVALVTLQWLLVGHRQFKGLVRTLEEERDLQRIGVGKQE